MKILFVYTNINGAHADSFADGISMIMAVTKKIYPDIKFEYYLLSMDGKFLNMKT